ncbi:hypothetical protein [Martelella mediterranea]|uniref:Uncharacterized protein n=1 Tax=Martelella mediterranea TaxID=293089 RepID=A0A4R3NNQ9_9HYPH|nr:hypothetical protein [Martelella mediterranea]TCT37426.1 hypothetical protein EDC90_10183 [Martelella mediterranea]
MKFILTDIDRYWWPVVVRVPDPDRAGRYLEQELEVFFEPESQDEAIARLEKSETLKTAREQIEHERQQLTDVVKGWRGVEDDDGNPFTFTADNFKRAINKSWFRQALYRAYRESLSGEEARLGN